MLNHTHATPTPTPTPTPTRKTMPLINQHHFTTANGFIMCMDSPLSMDSTSLPSCAWIHHCQWMQHHCHPVHGFTTVNGFILCSTSRDRKNSHRQGGLPPPAHTHTHTQTHTHTHSHTHTGARPLVPFASNTFALTSQFRSHGPYYSRSLMFTCFFPPRRDYNALSLQNITMALTPCIYNTPLLFPPCQNFHQLLRYTPSPFLPQQGYAILITITRPLPRSYVNGKNSAPGVMSKSLQTQRMHTKCAKEHSHWEMQTLPPIDVKASVRTVHT